MAGPLFDLISRYTLQKKLKAFKTPLSLQKIMRLVKHLDFGPVQGFELGHTPFGQPFITTHVYFVDGVMIDTGQKHLSREIQHLVADFPVQTILLTHYHEDHSGNAAMLKHLLDVPILGHPITIEKLKTPFKIFPYQKLLFGAAGSVEVLPLPNLVETDNYCFKPIHTPGHSRDHMVFWEAEQGWLFSGDLYLGDRAKYFRADERIKDEIQSLKIVRELDFDSVFCAHHPKVRDGKKSIIRKLDFLENLYGSVEELYKQGFDIGQIMRKLKIKETYFLMMFCFGNISARNMVRSVINAIDDENKAIPA
jgi:glyoxylase-like metal-dependent hydrolase (beta-lactamase superfamily II)